MMSTAMRERLYRNIPLIITACCTLSLSTIYLHLPILFLAPLFEATKGIVMEVGCILLPPWKRIVLLLLASVCVIPYLLQQIYSDRQKEESSWVNFGLVFGITIVWLAVTAVPESILNLEKSVLERAYTLSNEETSMLLAVQVASALEKYNSRYRLGLLSSENLIICISLCTTAHVIRERKRLGNALSLIGIVFAVLSVFFLTTIGDLLWSAIVVAVFWNNIESGLFNHAMLTVCVRREIPVLVFALISLWITATNSRRFVITENTDVENSRKNRGKNILVLLASLPLPLLLDRGFDFYKVSTECRVYVDSIQSGLHLFTAEYTVPFAYGWNLLTLFPCVAAVLYMTFLLYDCGMKEHPWLYLLLSGLLVATSYWPGANIAAKGEATAPVASILLSLLGMIMLVLFWITRKRTLNTD